MTDSIAMAPDPDGGFTGLITPEIRKRIPMLENSDMQLLFTHLEKSESALKYLINETNIWEDSPLKYIIIVACAIFLLEEDSHE